MIPGGWTQMVAARVRTVPWLASLGESALAEVIAAGQRVRFKAGQTIVGELEVGDALYLILEGHAEATLGFGERKIGDLEPGSACGELAVLTEDLRSATVKALTEVRALRLGRTEFETILRRHPQVAVHFVRELSRRLADTERALDEVLNSVDEPSTETIDLGGGKGGGPFRRAWRELVVSRRNEASFIGLTSFVLTLACVQLVVQIFRWFDADLFTLLRNAYTLGFALVVGSVGASLARFSPSLRRAITVAYGVGFALIVNELSVFLAFDTFYLDMTTRDPRLEFSVDQLYRRSESDWAIAIVFAILAQVTYLRRFYRRIGFLLLTRFRRLWARA